MSLFDKAKDLVGENKEELLDKAADAAEENINEETTDSILNKVPGGEKADDFVGDDTGKQVGDAIRDNLKDNN